LGKKSSQKGRIGSKKAVKILVVDDVQLCRMILERKLRSAGHEVLLAESGEEALQLIDIDPPDVILLDLMMPGMDGEETLRRIQRTGGRPMVIVVSAAIDRDRLLRLKELGVCGFIAKPINFQRLEEEIEKALESRRRLEKEIAELVGRSNGSTGEGE